MSTKTPSLNNASNIVSRIKDLKGKGTGAVENTVGDLESGLDDITSSIKDPIGGSLKKILFKINNITSNIEIKINKLSEDAVKSLDSKGRVELVGSTIVVTVKPSDVEKANVVKRNIDKTTKSINTNLQVLSTTLKTLTGISTAIRAITIALDVQEALMLINPATAATMGLIKKVLKLLTLRDVMKEYSKVLAEELRRNQEVVQRLVDRFRGLNIQIVVSDEANKGNEVTDAEAADMIATMLIGGDITVSKAYEEYRGPDQKEYLLVVEKYDSEQNIGRAKDKYSGLLVAQTAPSYFATGEELLEELKNILDTSL